MHLREKIDSFGMLPGIQIKNAYKVTWVVCHGIDFRKTGVIMHEVDADLPMFGVIKQIWNRMYVNFYILSMFHLKHYISVNASSPIM